MSSIGKILIVVNAILGLFVFGFASAVVYKSDNWKQKYEDESAAHKKTQTDLQGQIDSMSNLKTQAESAATKLTQEKSNVQIQLDSTTNALEQEKKISAELRGSLTKLSETSDNYRQQNEDLSTQLQGVYSEKDKIRDAKDEATSARDNAEREMKDAVEALRACEKHLAELQDKISALTGERDSLDARLKTMVQLTGVSLDAVQAQPQIDGMVSETAADAGMIALNVGSKQGVQAGFSFDIFAGNVYKGKVVVDRVEAGMCSARIKYLVPGVAIQKGDSATTRL